MSRYSSERCGTAACSAINHHGVEIRDVATLQLSTLQTLDDTTSHVATSFGRHCSSCGWKLTATLQLASLLGSNGERCYVVL
ncbi:unnamed protein product [Sphagnum balticum]